MIKKKTFAVSNDSFTSTVDPKSLQCRVTLLDGEEIIQDFNRKVPGQMVLDWVASTLGILEREYFGLLYLSEKAQMQWLDLVKPLKKQITKVSCRFSFLVKYYAVDPATLQGLTRHLFVMQLKRDIAAGTLALPQAGRTQILAFILQAELGDLNPLLQRENYISHFHLVPNQTSELEHEMEECHEKLRGMSRKEAILKFLLRVKWLDGYGLRLYSVKGIKNSIMQLGISPPGVSLHQRGTKTVTYLWAQIIRVSYKGKKFTLTVVKDEGKPHYLNFEMDSFSKTKNMWKITIDMLNFYRSQAEGVTIGREVDSLVDVLDTQGSPHPTLNRRMTGEFQGIRGSPRRSSLPSSARHAISASPGSVDSSPQPPRFADLVDSSELNERGIDVSFPPTPPSSRSEHESSHLQMSAELSLNAANVSPDSGSEQYRRFSAVQAALHPASALRSSGRRRFRSHLLQLGEDEESRDLESSELRTYKNYVLATDSPPVGSGRSSGFQGNLAPLPARSKSTSPTYVNLQYYVEGGSERRLYSVEEKADSSSDEGGKEAPFKASEVSNRTRCYSAMGISHEPKPKHPSKDKRALDSEAPAPVRQTRHDVSPSSLNSPTTAPAPQGHWPARWKEASKNQMSAKGVSSSHVDQQNVLVRQVSADDRVLFPSAMEKDAAPYRPRSSSLQTGAPKSYNKARARRVSGSSKDTVSDNDDSRSLQSSGKSSVRSQESLMKLAETLGYLPTEVGPPTRATVEPMEPLTVLKHSPSVNNQSWGSSKAHLYENLPDEDMVAAITTLDFDSGDFAAGHLKQVYSRSAVASMPTSADYLKDVSAVIHVGGKKPEIILPVNATRTPQEDSGDHRSSGKSVNRTPSSVTLNRVITPPPEFAGDFDSGGEETGEDEGKDFTVDWTPHVSRKSSFMGRSRSEESISIASNTLEQQIFRVQQTGEVADSGLVTTGSAMEATRASVGRKEKWDRQDADLGSCSEARMDDGAPYTRKGSAFSISKLPGYISVSPIEEPQHAERLFISNPSGSDVDMSSGRNSPDFPTGLMRPLRFTSERQLTSSASSSPGSKISQHIIATSSPKLKLLGDSLCTQPLSKLAKLVDQMQDSSPKPPAQRKAISTRKEANPPDIVRKRLQMPDDSEVEEPSDMLTKKEPGRREAKELRNSMNEHRRLREDAPSALAASRERQKEELAVDSRLLGSKLQDPQYRVVGERGNKKRTANTSELNPTTAAQGRGGPQHWGPGHTHPVGYVPQRQGQMMTSRNIPLTSRPSPMQSQVHSAEYYEDAIDPYAVSRRYYPEELGQMPPSSPSSMVLGRHQYSHVPSHRMSPSPVNPQFVGEPVLSQQSNFSPNMRNTHQYRSFQNSSQYRKNPFYPHYPARVVSPSTPPPMYLHPPDYHQGYTRREAVESPSSLRHQPNGQEERFDLAATVTGDHSGSQQLPQQQRQYMAGVYSSLQRPPSRADAPRRFMSPDQPMPRMLMHSQEPLHLSQPVTNSSYYYEQLRFNPNFRHSYGASPTNVIKPVTSYWYSAAPRPPQPVPKQQPIYVRQQPGAASQQRPAPRPRAHPPVVLTTPAASNNARRSYETLLEEDTSEISYCLL